MEQVFTLYHFIVFVSKLFMLQLVTYKQIKPEKNHLKEDFEFSIQMVYFVFFNLNELCLGVGKSAICSFMFALELMAK